MLRPSLSRWSTRVVAVLAVGLLTAGTAAANGRDDGHSFNHGNFRHHPEFRFRNHEPTFTVTPLVSDQPGVAAHTDPNLVNGWGIVAGPSTPWWVSNQGTSTSTLYDGLGNLFPPPPNGPLVVGVPGGPTGVVFNGGANLKVSNGVTDLPAKFIWATLSGTIQGWPGGLATAVTAVDNSASHAVYTGLAIDGDTVYAANFAGGTIDVFDGSWAPVVTPGAFTDPYLPPRYQPFGIQQINGNIFVTYAFLDPGQMIESHARGLGIVDEYSPTGVWEHRVGSFGGLNAPWGVAWAPATGFGRANGELLVGNFGDGHINAFVQRPWGQWLPDGQLRGPDHRPLAIDGLWGIAFGNGTASGPTTSLYFAAGPDHTQHGLFGTVTANP
jgi:uncharacterized protein (TIGR03118 family)